MNYIHSGGFVISALFFCIKRSAHLASQFECENVLRGERSVIYM